MNRIMNEKWPWIDAAHGMRSQLFNILGDADLAISPGGQTMTLGALCRQMGETEHAYFQSLKTFKQEWMYRHIEADVASHIVRLKAWFPTMVVESNATITTFWYEDGNRTI